MSAKTAGSLAAGLLTVLLAQASDPAAAAAGGTVVQCHIESLGTVQETQADDCNGRIIDDEEAAAIRKARRDYIQKVLKEPADRRVQGRWLAGLGSGFFVADDGSVVTSHHVINDCAVVSISPTFGEMVLASSIVTDAKTDLALLRTDIPPPAVAPLVTRDDTAILGPAFVIGYPNRGLVTIEPILSVVEILQQRSNTERGPAIVVRGDIRQGNSGGPLLDSGGNVIGVVFAKINTVNVYQATGQVVREIGLALPIEIVESFLKSNNVDYRVTQRRAPQTEERILTDARPFVAQIGCWK